MPIHPIAVRERGEGEGYLQVTHTGGPNDGMMFRTVDVQMSDGTTVELWKSNAHPGLYRNVFVPWDFEHEKCIDP